MGPGPVVEPEAVFQSPLGLQDAGIGLQVHLASWFRCNNHFSKADLAELPTGELAAPCLREGRLWLGRVILTFLSR